MTFINICEPASVQSANSTVYFVILIDRFSLYCTVVLLSTKSAKITLKVLQVYYIEVEHQIGKKLHVAGHKKRIVQSDIGEVQDYL